MERSFVKLVAVALFVGFSAGAHAQAPAQGQQPNLPVAEVTDADLEKFANIYVALQETVSKYEAEMLAVETEEEARDIQVRAQKESVDTVAQHGWTPDEYVAVAQAINTDPGLAEKTRRLIDGR